MACEISENGGESWQSYELQLTTPPSEFFPGGESGTVDGECHLIGDITGDDYGTSWAGENGWTWRTTSTSSTNETGQWLQEQSEAIQDQFTMGLAVLWSLALLLVAISVGIKWFKRGARA